MSWTKGKGETPRKLTLKEINYILENFQTLKINDERIDEINRINVLNDIESQLKSIELVPSGLDQLLVKIQNRYWASLIAPGEPVGMLAAAAISSVMTQAALNTFHSSGRSKDTAVSQISSLKNVINTSAIVKFPSVVIHFTDKFMNYEQTLNRRIDIIGKTPFDLLRKDLDSIIVTNTEQFLENDPWWYNDEDDKLEKVKRTLVGMRIYFDTVQLYKSRITLHEIAERLATGNIVFCAPMNYAYIDIFMDPDTSIPVDVDDDEKMTLYQTVYLMFCVRESLGSREFTLKGIPGIADYSVNSYDILTTNMVKMSVVKDGNVFKYTYDKYMIKETGVTVDKYKYLCDLLGINILKSTSRYFTTDKNIEVELANAADNEAIEEASRYYFATCYGVNAEDVMSGKYTDNPTIELIHMLDIEGIDLERIYSNDIHQIARYFGIEKAREAIERIFYKIIGTSVAFIHISTVADLLTVSGVPRGANFPGISKIHSSGHISKASFERAGKIITDHALVGDKESVKNLPVALLLGANISNGTGKSRAVFGDRKNKRYYIDDQITNIKNYNVNVLKEVIEDKYGVKPIVEPEFDIEQELAEIKGGLEMLARYPGVGEQLIIPEEPVNEEKGMSINKNSIKSVRHMTPPIMRETNIKSIEDDDEDEDY